MVFKEPKFTKEESAALLKALATSGMSKKSTKKSSKSTSRTSKKNK